MCWPCVSSIGYPEISRSAATHIISDMQFSSTTLYCEASKWRVSSMSNACRVRRLAVAHERRQIAYALENISALKNAKIKKKKKQVIDAGNLLLFRFRALANQGRKMECHWEIPAVIVKSHDFSERLHLSNRSSRHPDTVVHGLPRSQMIWLVVHISLVQLGGCTLSSSLGFDCKHCSLFRAKNVPAVTTWHLFSIVKTPRERYSPK